MFHSTLHVMHYADRLTEKIKETSAVCVGLDPVLEKFPEGVTKDLAGMEIFCNGITDAVKNTAACVKVNLAFFERHGWQGMKAFFSVCAHAKAQGLIVIADGKRNDIGSTCEAYADAYLSKDSPIDALTVTPYLGSDSIKPFLKRCSENGKGIYVLVKTSNESSGELQDLPVGDESLHEHVAQLVESWATEVLGASNLSSLGAVVGATYPEEMKYLRTLMPHVPFLIPGYGAQGGTAEDVARGFLKDGTGAVVNSSRSILYASSGKDWAVAAANATKTMSAELAKALA
jgi:orotidine-5'-phosphate decarboxylase